MNTTPQAELAAIGRKAAEHLAGSGTDLFSVPTGSVMSGDTAYFSEFTVDPAIEIEEAVALRLKLARAVQDELIHRGDKIYPYVRVR